jgi:hypothetical protein
MKNTKNHASKKIMASASMLLVSAFMLSSATYAWFTMNKTVTVNGMEMKTQVGSNLLISDNNYEADYSTTALTQSRAALLEPVSSVSGANGTFFYTVDALGNGDAVTDVYTAYAEGTDLTTGAIDLITASTAAGTHPETDGAGKAAYDADFNSTYTIGTAAAGAATAYYNAYGYVDYVFYLKATADSTNQNIKMTKCNLLYNDGAVNTTGTVGDNVDKAWRVAVFCSSVTGGAGEQASNATSANLKAILTLNGAANHTAGKAVDSGTSVNGTVSYNAWSDTTNSAIATLANKATGYYMVTVRVWLEGEDTTCTSKTYAQLSEEWTLDCEFSMDSTKSAVANIGSVAP